MTSRNSISRVRSFWSSLKKSDDIKDFMDALILIFVGESHWIVNDSFFGAPTGAIAGSVTSRVTSRVTSSVTSRMTSRMATYKTQFVKIWVTIWLLDCLTVSAVSIRP